MPLKATIFFFIILPILTSCAGKKEKNIPTVAITKKEPLESDTTRAVNFYDFFYVKNEPKDSPAKIDSLFYSFDSLQIRYWITGGLYRTRQLVIISNTHPGWTGTYYQLQAEKKYISGMGSNEYLHGPEPQLILQNRKVSPKCGWKLFIDSLVSLNIKGLPDRSQIPEMKVSWTDGYENVVEVRSKDLFRFYSYPEPHQFVKKFEQARKMDSIGNLIYRQLIR